MGITTPIDGVAEPAALNALDVSTASERIELDATFTVSLPSSATAAQALDLFRAQEDLPAIAVLEDGRPVGLVNRASLTNRMMAQFGGGLLERSPIRDLMQTEPTIVELNTSVEDLVALLSDTRPEAIADGVIFVEDGAFHSVAGAPSIIRKLDRLRAALVEESKAKSQFVASISHDLRTPLNAIIGLSDILAKRTLGDGPSARKKYAEFSEDIRNNSAYLHEMVEALLDMSRLEAHEYKVTLKPIQLGEVVECAARMLINAAEQTGVVVSTRIEFKDKIFADRRAITSVINNILGNAIKFTPRGQRVSLYCGMTSEERVMIRVIDSGPGFAATADSKKTEIHQAKGAGMGLKIVRMLVDQHRGELIAKDRAGAGAEVRVYLPISPPPDADIRQQLT